MTTAHIVASTAVAAALVAVGVRPATAQQPAPAEHAAPAEPVVPPSYHRHDGLFLRLVLGVPYAAAADDVDGSEVELSGPGGLFALSIGASVTTRVVVFGDLYAIFLPGPSAEVDEEPVRNVSDTWYAVGGFGVGVAHYFPSNVHLALSIGPALGVGELALTDGAETRVETDVHPSAHGVVGYEWWLADEWGLGVALDLMLLSAPDRGDDGVTVHLLSAGVAASLTHN